MEDLLGEGKRSLISCKPATFYGLSRLERGDWASSLIVVASRLARFRVWLSARFLKQ